MYKNMTLIIGMFFIFGSFSLVGCNTTRGAYSSEDTISQEVSSKSNSIVSKGQSTSSSHNLEIISSSVSSSVPAPSAASSENSQQFSSSIAPSESSSVSASSVSSENNLQSSQSSTSLLPQQEAETVTATNGLASQLVSNGGGSTGIALSIRSTAGYYKELNRVDGFAFLSKIGLDSFTAAEMKVDIPIPDAMIGTIEDNFISIGMPHTSTLYIYRDYEQAVIVGENKMYYTMPADTYQTVLELLS